MYFIWVLLLVVLEYSKSLVLALTSNEKRWAYFLILSLCRTREAGSVDTAGLIA